MGALSPAGPYLRAIRCQGPGIHPYGLAVVSEDRELTAAVEALDLLVQKGYYVDNDVFHGVLKKCIAQKNLVIGRRIHALAVKSGDAANSFVANHIMRMYGSHGKLKEAMHVFTKVPAPSRHMWASIIMAHARNGRPWQAIKLYERMRKSRVEPDNHIFVAVLKACAIAKDLSSGREVHADTMGTADENNLFVGNCLVDMYSKCGSLQDARTVFDNMPTRDLVTWNSMIAGYVHHGLGQEALALYESMQGYGTTAPDAVTFICLVQACTSIGALDRGTELHTQVQERGLEDHVVIGTCLVDMYSKCGCLEEARQLFNKLPNKNLVTWNAMIAGYAQQGFGREALTLYGTMQLEACTPADAITYVCLLQACATTKNLREGQKLHAKIQGRGLEADVVVGTSLLDMYAKCGRLEDAQRVFDSLPNKNLVTWTAMISGYAQFGLGQRALETYASMQREGMAPANAVTFVCLLQACGSVAGLEKGIEIHAQITKIGLQATDPSVANALIDMYGKCGSMVYAQQVFDALAKRDVVAWSALVTGYARQGKSELIFDLFQRMRQEGIQPNGITFLGVLSVCSHVGLVDKAQEYFEIMDRDYGITPSIEHFTCMVDLLGRSGQLDKAMEMIKRMPFQPDSVIWMSVLGACRKWRNVELGRQAFEGAVRLDKNDAAAYVVMSNIYAAAKMEQHAEEIQAMRVNIQAWKEPGQSWWTDINGIVNTFVAGDIEHPEWHQIDAELRAIFLKVKEGNGAHGHCSCTQDIRGHQ